MAKTTVQPSRDAGKIASLLCSPEVLALVADLESTRWTGRPGYPVRAMVGMTLVKSFYVPADVDAHGCSRDGARRTP